MNDLFTSHEEAREERAAIMADSGLTATADDLHRCEVSSVIRRCFPDGNKAAEYFALVEKKRGKEPADRLRDDCRVEWKREIETRKAIRNKVDGDKVNK